MKTRPANRFRSGSVAIGLALAASTLFCAGVEAPLDAKGSAVKFTGDAFLHSFHGEVKEMSGSVELDPGAVPPIQKAVLRFKTGELTTFNKGRDEKMWAWLKVAADPDASFQLGQVKLVEGDYKSANEKAPARFSVQGVFTLHGVKQALSGTAVGWRDNRRLIVSGETTLDTLKYGLPQIREAVMTVGTKVKISYRFSFVLPAEFGAK